MKIKENASSSKQLEELQSASPNSEIFLVGVISSHNFPFYVLRRFAVTSKFFNKSRDVSVPVPFVFSFDTPFVFYYCNNESPVDKQAISPSTEPVVYPTRHTKNETVCANDCSGNHR